jgi:hypothetical protein
MSDQDDYDYDRDVEDALQSVVADQGSRAPPRGQKRTHDESRESSVVSEIRPPGLYSDVLNSERRRRIEEFRAFTAECQAAGVPLTKPQQQLTAVHRAETTAGEVQEHLQQDALQFRFTAVPPPRDQRLKIKFQDPPPRDHCYLCLVGLGSDASMDTELSRRMDSIFFDVEQYTDEEVRYEMISRFYETSIRPGVNINKEISFRNKHGREMTNAEREVELLKPNPPSLIRDHYERHSRNVNVRLAVLTRQTQYLANELWNGAIFKLDTLDSSGEKVHIDLKAVDMWLDVTKREMQLWGIDPAKTALGNKRQAQAVERSVCNRGGAVSAQLAKFITQR